MTEGKQLARFEHEHGHGSDDILAPMRGRMGGILGHDGEPVIAGQPVAWMQASPERPS